MIAIPGTESRVSAGASIRMGVSFEQHLSSRLMESPSCDATGCWRSTHSREARNLLGRSRCGFRAQDARMIGDRHAQLAFAAFGMSGGYTIPGMPLQGGSSDDV
jgi:hypothetical protein